MSAKTSKGRERPSERPSERPTAGPRRGEETRLRILNGALEAFGEASFRVVTTRQISEAAGVSLPTLQYYFGDKEGLYLACAEAIVERYRSYTIDAAVDASKALEAACSADAARSHLKAVIGALAGLLVGSTEGERWIQFVARELREPGPAFEILYARLWRPGVELVALLIARILGVAANDPTARVHALLMISALLAFQSGRSVSLRTMNWPTIGREELDVVLSSLNAQIDAIGLVRS